MESRPPVTGGVLDQNPSVRSSKSYVEDLIELLVVSSALRYPSRRRAADCTEPM
jgi:hypothetical protein